MLIAYRKYVYEIIINKNKHIHIFYCGSDRNILKITTFNFSFLSFVILLQYDRVNIVRDSMIKEKGYYDFNQNVLKFCAVSFLKQILLKIQSVGRNFSKITIFSFRQYHGSDR